MEEAKELQNKVEAVLFAAGRKISLEEISRICKDEQNAVKGAISSLIQRQKDNEEPLLVVEESDGFKMIVREMYSSYVKQIIPATELGKSILETLAVIAWKQPANQSEIVKIRSSKAYDHIAELEDLGFVHKERKGRSFIIKTTQKFADYFDLPSKDEIKKMMQPAVEAMQLKAEQEDALKEKVAGMEVYYEQTAKKSDLAGMEVFEESEQKKQDKAEEPEKSEEGEEEGYSEEEQAEEEPITGKTAAKQKRVAKEEEDEESSEETEEKELGEEDQEEIDSMMKSAREEFESEKAAKKAELKQKAIDSLNEEEQDEIKIEEKGRKVDERLEGMLEINKKTFNKLKGMEEEEEYKPEEEEEEEEPAKKNNKKNRNNL